MRWVFAKIVAGLDRVIDVAFMIANVLVGIAAVIVVADVVLRTFFNHPQKWVLEVTEYCIVFLTLLGAAWVLKKEAHVSMDLIVTRFNPRARSLLRVITSLIGMAVCLTLVVYGVSTVWQLYQWKQTSMTSLQLPTWPFVAIVPIGGFLLLVQFVRRAFDSWGMWKGTQIGNPER